jgi:hypothetical protein
MGGLLELGLPQVGNNEGATIRVEHNIAVYHGWGEGHSGSETPTALDSARLALPTPLGGGAIAAIR